VILLSSWVDALFLDEVLFMTLSTRSISSFIVFNLFSPSYSLD
jgi:hypothetical protein